MMLSGVHGPMSTSKGLKGHLRKKSTLKMGFGPDLAASELEFQQKY